MKPTIKVPLATIHIFISVFASSTATHLNYKFAGAGALMNITDKQIDKFKSERVHKSE